MHTPQNFIGNIYVCAIVLCNFKTIYIYVGGIGGTPFFRRWQRVWVSLNHMFRIYSQNPSGKKLPYYKRDGFFIRFLEFAENRSDHTKGFSYWPNNIDDKRCFVITTHGSSYYFYADSEKEKWLGTF